LTFRVKKHNKKVVAYKAPEVKKIENMSLSPKDRIIYPLDVPSLDEAKSLIRELKDHVGLFKVGVTLILGQGLSVINQVADLIGGQKIFIDVKFHDIPWQIGSAANVIMSGPRAVRFITVHASDGERIISTVVEKVKNGTQVLGITVLTSVSKEESLEMDRAAVEQRVLALAQISKRAGCAGVVCSGHEAKIVKATFGRDFIIVTPGIRPRWANIPMDDQRRITTPREAILNGADYIVVGRPISFAKDKPGAAQKIAEEVEKALANSSNKP
jgi:orotidine-5'-phosphate decarboxylase